MLFIVVIICASPLCSSGPAVFPGGGDGGGEGGVPDETDEQRGRGGCRQHQAAVLQQGACGPFRVKAFWLICFIGQQVELTVCARVCAARGFVCVGAPLAGGRGFARAGHPVGLTGHRGGDQ